MKWGNMSSRHLRYKFCKTPLIAGEERQEQPELGMSLSDVFQHQLKAAGDRERPGGGGVGSEYDGIRWRTTEAQPGRENEETNKSKT